MDLQKDIIAKAILGNKDKGGGIRIPDFKLYYKATVIKTAWYCHKNTHVLQWKKTTTEGAETIAGMFRYLIFHKGAKNTCRKKDILFGKWCLGITSWLSRCRRLNLDLYLSLCTKLKSKCIKDLNIKTDTSTRRKIDKS